MALHLSMWKSSQTPERVESVRRTFALIRLVLGDAGGVSSAAMESGKPLARVVARFRDGRVLKGHTQSFDPNRPTFRLHSPDADPQAEPLSIAVADLKAVFFVRDFTGDRAYNEHKAFEKRPTGRVLEVTFFDGERLVGTSLTYDPSRPGFFLFPADPRSNNERIFIVRSATTSVRPVAPGEAQPSATS